MTPRTTQRGLIGLVIGILLGLPGGFALAQEPPATQPSEGETRAQPERHPETQEALERLLRFRDQMETERKAREQTGEEPEPPRRSVRDRRATTEEERQRRAARLEELRAKARASTQEASPSIGEHGVPDDFVGPPESLSNNPPGGVAAETQPGITPLPGPVTAETTEQPVESEAEVQPAAAKEPEEEPVAKVERKPRERRPKSETDKEQWFTFVDMPWEDVVLHFVERIGKPLMDQEDLYVGGTLTYVNEQEFTKQEALDELNLLLHEKGYLFVEREHHIYLVPLSEMSAHIDLSRVYPSVLEFNEADPRDMEYVTVYYQVPDRKAQVLVEAFLDALPDYTRLSSLDDSNQIKLVALARDVRKFLTLEQMIDISPQDPRKLRVFEIKTNARDIERMVREFMNLGGGGRSVQIVRDRRTGRMVPQATGGDDKGDDVQLIADDRTNSIIAKGTEDKLDEIRLLIEQFDQKPDLGEFDTRVVQVEHADAAEVASLLNQIFQQEQGQARSQTPNWQRLRMLQQQAQQRGRRTTRQPTRTTPQAQATSPEDIMAEGIFERAKKTIRLVAEPRQNLLFVYANAEGHTRVREMLKDIDKPQSENFQIFTLENASVEAIAPVLTQIVSGMTATSLRSGRGGPHMVPDEGKNQFYVIADRDEMERIKQLIEQLDVPGPDQERHVVELKNLRPSDVAQMVQTLIGGGGGSVRSSISRGVRGRGRGRVPMTPIGGSVAAEFQVVPLDDAQILIVICSDEEWEKVEETIRLWDEKALTNSPRLETFTINSGNAQSIANTLSGMYRSYSHPAFGRSPVFIQAEGNKVLVYGIRPAIEEIKPLIEALDQEEGSKYEILPLANADANTVAQEALVLFAASGGGRYGRGGGGGGGVVIQPEPETNSLIVQADAPTLEKIKDYALLRDQQAGEQAPEQRFFTLNYATPRDVASAIQQIYGGGGGRRFRGMTVGTQIKAVATATQVIVEAPADKLVEIEAFIRQLDDPQGKEIVIKTIKLEGADVAQIARKLSTAYRQKPNVQAVFDADPGSETVLVTCNKDALEEIEALIAEFHEASRGVTQVVEFRQMKYATAPDAANWLRDQLITYMLPILGRQASQQIKVTADARTNRVVINAPNVAVEYGKKLLEQFDVVAEQPPETIMFTDARKLPGLDVRSLANNLNQAFRNMPQRPDRLHATFAYDAMTETLIISAPKDMSTQIDELIAKFAQDVAELEPEQKFIVIKEADANYVAGQLRELLINQLRRTRGNEWASRVSITVDTRLNRVVINAPKSVIPMAESLVAELDQRSTTEGQIHTISLESADANAVLGTLRQIFSEKIRARTLQISVEPMTNSLIVGGTKEDFEEIDKWAKNLDEQAAKEVSETRIFDLKNANPWEVHAVLQQTFVNKGYGRTQPANKQIKISIVGGRSLVVQAPPEKLTEIEALITELDALVANKAEMRTYDLPGMGSKLNDFARQLQNQFNQQAQAREQRVAVVPYPPADALIITALPNQFEQIEQMMDQLKPLIIGAKGKTEFFSLKYVDAGQIAGVVQDLVQKRSQAGGRRGSQDFTVTADPRTNRLIVFAPETILPDVRAVITELDVEVPDDNVVTVVLRYADPWEVRNMINDVFGQRGQRSGQSQQQQVYVTVSNNTLVIKAPPKKLEQINELIGKLDNADIGGLQIKTYQLKVLDAAQVAVQVQTYLRSVGGVNRRGQMQPGAFAEPTTNTLVVIAPQQQLPFIEGLINQIENSKIDGGDIKDYTLTHVRAEHVANNVDQMLKAKVMEREGQARGRTVQMRTAVFAEPASNRLFVYAPENYQELAARLIEMIDAEGKTTDIVHIITLEQGDAAQIAQTLQQVIRGNLGGSGSGGGRSGTATVRITADAGSNSILLAGMPKDLAEVEQWIEELEGQSTRIPELQTFQLQYATTSEVEQTLNNIFGGARNPQDQVTVTPDEYNSRLLVTANRRKMRQVEAFVKQLDQEPPSADTLPGGRQLFFVDINRGSASDIAWDVRGLLPDEYEGGPSIEADWFDEYLVVKCRPSEFDKIERYIREFERRAKIERVQRLISLRGADTEAILVYLMKRNEGEDNLIIQRPPEKPKMERLIVDVWGAGEAPEGVTDEDRSSGATGGRRIAPFQTGLPLAQVLLDDDRREPPGQQPAASRPASQAAQPADKGTGREVGETIKSPIEKEPTRVVWQEDGTLLLYGTRDDVDDINNAIELFMEERSVGEVVRIFRFRYGDVNAAAEILSIMFDVRRQQIVIPQQQQRGRQQEGREDEQGRRQPTNMLEQLQGMVGGRQQGQRGGQQQQQLRIATDPGHNYLIIKCDETYLPEIHQLLRELDIPPGKVELKVFQLRNLLAEETAENIKDVLGISKAQQRRAPTPRRGGRGNQQQQLMEMLQQQMVSVPGVEGGAKVERVEIVPNAVTNALMVSAPPEVMGLIESVIKELEGLEGRSVVGIHHYDLQHAKVDDILPLLQEIFDATAGGGGGGGPRRGGGGGGASPASMGPVIISGDPRTNTLIFTAEGKDVGTIEAQIAKLDIAGAVSEVEMYVCLYGDAEAIAQAVEAIFSNAGGGRPGRGGPRGQTAAAGTDVRIVAESATNTILIWGPLDKRDLIFAKIEELDRLSKRDIREIAVVFADPEELAEKLMEVFGGSAGGGQATQRRGRGPARQGGGAQTSGRVMIMGDKDAKKLLVRAPDEVCAQIEEIVATLDRPSEQMKLRRFQLKYADATEVVDSVKAAMTEFLQLSRTTGDEVDFDAFTAMPDPRTNSITVVGTDKTFLFVHEVLAAVDVETPEDQKKEFRIFLLEKADAVTVAEVINGFATGGGGTTQTGRRGGGRGGAAVPGGAREMTIYAVPEESTNSVMVIGRMEDIDRVEKEVIEKLEDSISDRYQIATVPVKNVPPSQIVSFIWQFIDQGMTQAQAGGRRGGGTQSGGGRNEDGGPQIVPNDSGKTLIVRGTKRQIDDVRELVQRFDDKDIVTQTIKVIPIPRGQDATRLAADIQTIVNESEQNIAEQTGRRPRLVTVGADEYANALIVAGDPTAFGMVETIINQLQDVRSGGEVTRVIEFRNLSASDAEQIINDLQQDRRGSSGTRRSTPRGGGGARPRRRGALTPDQLPGGDQQPTLVPPLAFVEPYIGVGPLMPVIGLLTVTQWDDDEPVPARLGDLRRVVLASLNQEEPGTQPARGPARRAFGRPAAEQEPRPEEPATEPATLPAGITDTLSGVSGALKGEVTAKAVDSRRIIITGDEEDVEFIEQILLMMEQSASPAVIEVFALRSAKATALAPIIETAIKAQIEARTTSPGPQDRFSINAEGRSNSLIVSASEMLMVEIEDLIAKLDVEDPDGGTDFRTIALKNIRAVEAVAQLKPVIEKLMQQRDIPKESQVSISAIERSNSVMIVGTPNDVQDVERMVLAVDIKLAEDDEQASFVSADVVLLQLKNGQAEDIAKVLTEMIEEQQENARKADPEKPGEPFVKILRLRMADGRELPPLNLDRPIKILPEKGTNSLIVFSSKENNEALAAIVDVFDTLPIGVETDVKAFVLRHAAAEEIAKLIEEIFKEKSYLLRPSEGDSGGLTKGVLPPVPPGVAAKGLPYPLVVQHDARSNTVIVIGRTDAVILAGGLISELDRPTTDLGLKAYVLELKYMQATQVAEKLEELLDERAKALGGENEARDSAVIQPEERTNSLLVFATEEVYDMIEELVLELDAARKYSVVDVRYRPLKYADASKLQGFLQETFDAKLKAEQDTNKEANDSLTVMADTRTNSLLMTGTRDYLDEAEDLIAKLDEEGDATVVFRALKVRLNSAGNIAALLKDMVEKALVQQDSKLKGTPIHIAADPISDSLLIAAAREDMELIERWVEILDRPSEVGRMTKIIPLRRAPAEDVSKAVQDVFKQGTGQQDGQVDLTVTADQTTNSVVVFGPPALVNDIEGFVRQLDETEARSGVMVRLFKLQQADAEDAGDLLTRILDLEGGSVGGGTSRGGGGGSRQDAARQVMLIYQQEHPELGTETLKGWREDIVVISDLRTNSLVIEAPPESMLLMESLVAAVDVPPDAAKIRVFHLRNADAEQMVNTLKELFERETVGAGRAGDETARELVLGEGLTGGRQEIAFTHDIRTNSVIAAGTPGYLDIVEKFVLELDTIPIEERETFVYAPRNIPATDLATSLKEFSDEEQQRLDEIGDDVSIARRQERKIVAIANEEANRVLFDVDPRFKTAVLDVVHELDQPPPQVMIQVLIVEVTMDNSLDLGVEFAFQDLQYAKAGPTDTTTFDYVGGTDIGAAGSGLGGFTFTVTGADFNFLFRTLQNEGNLQVLSRPQIVAMDNQEAMIDISDDVPYVTGTSTSVAGQVSTTVARERIGIKLTVTPQINPEGFVRMEVTQEVSDFTGSTVDVGQGVTAPVFFRREAKTVISVKDNETVVLGGLITSRKENREQKIPILGDIPGLGRLFRNQTDDSKRTELLLVMTPHVIRTADDYRTLSLVERDRMEVIPTEVLTDPLMQGLRMDPEDAARLAVGGEPIDLIEREVPSEQAEQPTDELYGPLLPALRPERREEPVEPDSYDVPLSMSGPPEL